MKNRVVFMRSETQKIKRPSRPPPGERGPLQSTSRLEVVQQGPEEIAVRGPWDAKGAAGEEHVREHRCVLISID